MPTKPNKDDPWAAAQPPGTKVEPPKGRDYIGEACVALGEPLIKSLGTDGQSSSLLSAIIIAQALDRFSSKLVEAAAISKSRS